MGAEIFYYGAIELDCPKCEASEYPVGALNDYDVHPVGARVITGFDVS